MTYILGEILDMSGDEVGAINGAFVAQGFDAKRVTALEHVWTGLTTADVFPGVSGGLLRILWPQGTLASNRGLIRLLERHLPPLHSDLNIPMTAVAMVRASSVTRTRMIRMP